VSHLIRVDEYRARYELAVCLESSEAFGAIGESYADFTQTSEKEVAAALVSTASPAPA
jgi:predicted phosphoribosyltransferase